MVVVMQERASEDQIEKVVAHLVSLGMDVHRSTGVSRTVLGAVGDDRRLDPRLIEMLDGVSEVLRVTEPYKLASRAFKPEGTVVTIGDVRIGGDEVIVMAGPCSAETEEQVNTTACRGEEGRREDSCAAARSNRAAHRTASRASARKASGCCATRPISTT
jgi:3-deoxy-7-phosphoheptulonate synthase